MLSSTILNYALETTNICVLLLSDIMHEFLLSRMPPPRTPEMGGYGGGDDMRGGGHMNYEADRGYPPAERYRYHYNTDTHIQQ